MSADAKKNLAVLVSGGGTNLQAIIDGTESGRINGRVVLVVSSNADAYALVRAESRGIPTAVCALKDFVTREKRDEKITELLIRANADYVILAGYLGILTAAPLSAFGGRIVNIHPALLPKYGGKNCFGLNVHRQVLAAGEAFTGATVHFVDSGVDTGLIIASESIEVLPSDTPESLQKRLLENVENRLIASVTADLCDGKISVKDGKVVYKK
ncbi:MAG: phosphoribosylglycinamide formyltransferase [Clostridiales bacterium]|nr:phosphoribosylglycinamide formyltransferase [Clostridiales bacterium]